MCPQIEYGTQSVSIDDRTTKVDNRPRLKTWTIIKVTQSVVSKSGLTVQFFFRIFKISSKFVEVASGFFSSPDSVFIFFCDRGVSTTCSRKRFRLLAIIQNLCLWNRVFHWWNVHQSKPSLFYSSRGSSIQRVWSHSLQLLWYYYRGRQRSSEIAWAFAIILCCQTLLHWLPRIHNTTSQTEKGNYCWAKKQTS